MIQSTGVNCQFSACSGVYCHLLEERLDASKSHTGSHSYTESELYFFFKRDPLCWNESLYRWTSLCFLNVFQHRTGPPSLSIVGDAQRQFVCLVCVLRDIFWAVWNSAFEMTCNFQSSSARFFLCLSSLLFNLLTWQRQAGNWMCCMVGPCGGTCVPEV